MSATRFAAFRFLMGEMDERVNDLAQKRAVDSTIHVGGDLFVTIKTGFACVNLRKYFFRPECSRASQVVRELRFVCPSGRP